MEDTSKYITEQFHQGKEKVNLIKKKLKYVTKRDPTDYTNNEGTTPLTEGYKLIDQVYENIQEILDSSRIEMKERFKEFYKINYRNVIQKKSGPYLAQLDKLNSIIDQTIDEFEDLNKHGRFAKVC